MNTRRHPWCSRVRIVLACTVLGAACLAPPAGFARQDIAQEIAVNLSEGRVVVCPAKDGIVIATVDAHAERGSRQPVVLALSSLRAGVLMGAVEWVHPESSDKPVRLDSELARLAAQALDTKGQRKYENSANDIEAIGVALLERVRELAGQLHHKLNISEDEPLLRLVLAGYVPDYGPEVWSVDYHIRQDALGNDYWRTRVLRPSYNQVYPPEKGKPRTLVEVRYPPENRATDAPELLDLLRQNDPRIAAARAANELTAKSVTLVMEGQAQKSVAATDADFLRAALPLVNPPGTKLAMVIVDFERGFKTLLEPSEPPPPSADEKPREPEAPSLRRKPSN